MVFFDYVWFPIVCPWISPCDCPSGIVLDVESGLIRKDYVAPLLWCLTAMFTGLLLPGYDVRWGQMYTNNRSSCEQSSFMQSARHSLAGYGPSCAAERCDARCHAVSILRRLAHCNR
ncbi:hypothetical protein AVEN_85498-1 [Araneus ventricosus]|uniref:Uncharacterized protein n=1 Tax=Araneus ventricosus TaxID=182803 RepID=A0A4Y2GWD6_ARAVE|nr:hypothetical protein AVEN_85498-1 [Araneus ventricosus]